MNRQLQTNDAWLANQPLTVRHKSTVAKTDPERETLWLVVAIMITCIVLGRFVIPYGGSVTLLAGPIGYGIVAIGFVRGLLTFDRRRVMIYLAMVGFVMLGAAANALVSNPFNVATGWMSMLQFLALSAFATLSLRHPIPEERFFRTVNACFTFVAIAGLVQFIAQFAGLAIFRFSDFIPAQFLTEQLTGGGFNNEIPINMGNLYKSNGFFLAEPSIFSQLMAVAIAIETLYFRRIAFFGLFIAALLSSVSGTGWIVLITFVATVATSMGRRGIVVAGALSIGFGVALLLWSITLPDIFDAFISRYGEVFSTGSSGQIRFVTPFWISQEVLDRAPWALLLGVGSSVSEKFWRPYEGDINTPIKIILENGIPVLICYVLLITVGHQTPRQRRLVPALLVLLALAGNYAQFPPVLFPILLITPIAALRPAPILKQRNLVWR